MHRIPTTLEIAAALLYCEREFYLDDGLISHELIAEGLAFARPITHPEHPFYPSGMLAHAAAFAPSLTREQWLECAARADYLRSEQCEPPRYRT